MRTLLVASGKGGTGKTTVTAVLVALAARECRVAVADCDVEASNLPLALRATVTTREPFAGPPQVVVDERRCRGCGACVRACPFDAMAIGPEGHAAVDPWLCESCGACVRACPADAIALVPQVAGALFVGECWAGPVVWGDLRPGEDLSGRLVALVREHAADLARRHDADLLLVDGPPGVGCPAIAAMVGVDAVLAVTEPTPAAVHDLRRLAGLAVQLRVPVAVVLNKVDLSPSGAEFVRAACAELGLALVAEVRFDAELPRLMEAVASGRTEPARLAAVTGVGGIHAVWAGLAPLVGAGS
jgi:MinD superfamily P-loop ATPase